jgi:polyhydroxybutyrate depolymerase
MRHLLAALALLLASPVLAGVTHETFLYDGRARVALIERPDAPGQGPRPLIVVLHGAMLNGSLMRDFIRLSEAATAAGAVLAFPDSDGPLWNEGALAATYQNPLGWADDVGFLDTLLDRLVAARIADPARINVVGISNGGMMAHHYACRRAERLASVIIFKATIPADAAATCHPSRPVPVLMALGTADPIVRWDGRVVVAGLIEVQRRLSGPDGFALWRTLNRCAWAAAPVVLPHRGAPDDPWVRRHDGVACAAPTVLYEIVGGGHRLPGGEASLLMRALGRATPDADAPAMVLAFTGIVPAR